MTAFEVLELCFATICVAALVFALAVYCVGEARRADREVHLERADELVERLEARLDLYEDAHQARIDMIRAAKDSFGLQDR